jgi:hypothetical protein
MNVRTALLGLFMALTIVLASTTFYESTSKTTITSTSTQTETSTITWTGDIPGIAGTYEGRGNIEILYGSTIGKYTALGASISNYNEEAASPSVENVTFFLAMMGNSSVEGAVKIAANVTQSWNYTGGQWQVLQESWNYTTYDIQFPVMTG